MDSNTSNDIMDSSDSGDDGEFDAAFNEFVQNIETGDEELPVAFNEIVETSCSSEILRPPKRRRLPENNSDESLHHDEKRNVGTCTETRLSRFINVDDDDDEGTLCNICLVAWESSGKHRIVVLRCGHLYGESCISRWITSSYTDSEGVQRKQRNCPQCKARVSVKDIIPIYGKRIRIVDNSIETELSEKLMEAMEEHTRLNKDYTALRTLCNKYAQKCKEYEVKINELQQRSNMPSTSKAKKAETKVRFKFSLEHKFTLNSGGGGFRILKYSHKNNALITTSRRSIPLFMVHAVTLYDVNTYKPSKTINCSQRCIRDIALHVNENIMGTATMSKDLNIYDIRSCKAVNKISSEEHTYWSLTFNNSQDDKYLISGTSSGECLCYDMRQPKQIYKTYQNILGTSPVINAESFPATEDFPFGGLFICSLTSVVFIEFTGTHYEGREHSFGLTGPFMSMRVDAENKNILFHTRASSKNDTKSKFILATLIQNGDQVDLETCEFDGSATSPKTTRPTQFTVENTTYVAGFLSDKNIIRVYDTKTKTLDQELSCSDFVYDMDVFYRPQSNLPIVATLTDTQCTLYKYYEI